jgi:hypothetical protein
MGKAMFWLQVIIVSMIGIYLFKMFASQTSVQGLRDFAQAL